MNSAEIETALFNFFLDGDSSYFANDYLVHNKCCFLAGTKIAMADGTEKNIEDVMPQESMTV